MDPSQCRPPSTCGSTAAPVWSPKDDPEANKPKTAGIYSLEGDTLKLLLGEDARPKAFPQKEKQGVVTLKREKPKGKDDPKPPKGKADKPKGKVEPPGAPLAAVLKANKDTYKLDLGGRTADAFRKLATSKRSLEGAGPNTPVVDLVLEVRNTSDKDIKLFTLPDLAEVQLELKGPDALTVQYQGPITPAPPPEAVAIGPQGVHAADQSLNHGHRDISLPYWLARASTPRPASGR